MAQFIVCHETCKFPVSAAGFYGLICAMRVRHHQALGFLLAGLQAFSVAFAAAKRPPLKSVPAKESPDLGVVERLAAASRDSVVVISHFGRDGKEDGVG